MADNKRREFEARLCRIRERMRARDLDMLVVYGDEYRRENLRYTSGFWPIFERAAVLLPMQGEPVLIAAAEGEAVAREMSVWHDIRIVPEFECVTVADRIEYPFAKYTSFEDLRSELGKRGRLDRIGLVGLDAMPKGIYEALTQGFSGCEFVEAGAELQALRIIKSPYEIDLFRKAQLIADAGYKELIKASIPGTTETAAAAAGEYGARKAGAETVVFCIYASGKRTDTVVGRATEKRLEPGDLIMAALAVQYEGYIASIGFPFVIGEPNPSQIELIDTLVEASRIAFSNLGPGVRQGSFVKQVRDYFRKVGMEAYDLYPPLHGAGLAEAESPYPNEGTDSPFLPGMIANTDISLFRHPAGSNRIEEGLLITETGVERLSRLVPQLIKDWKEIRGIRLQTLV